MKKLYVPGLILSVLCAQAMTGCVASTEPSSDGSDVVTRASETSQEEEVGEAAEAVCNPGFPSLCTGWENGGRRCLANCTNINYWMDTGYAAYGTSACYNINYGDCQTAAFWFCLSQGQSDEGACWGHR